jgi:lambda family phage tail tape measure protein
VATIADSWAKARHEIEMQNQAARGVPVGPRSIGGVDVSVYGERGPGEQARAAKPLADQAAALRDVTPMLREYNEEQNRAFDLGRQLVAPQLAYEERLADIQRALAAQLITQDRANMLTRQAGDAYQRAQDELAGYADVVQQFEAPAQRYRDGLRAAGDALDAGRISAEQYNQAVDQIRSAYLAATPAGKTFTGGLEQSFLKAKLNAQGFGQQVADMLVSDVEKLSDALVTMAMNGEVSWRGMIEAMLSDLARLAARQLVMGLINMGISAATGSPSVPGISGPVTLPSQVARSAGAYSVPTSAAVSASTVTGGNATRIKIVNVFDQKEIHAAMESREGEQIQVNQMRRSDAAVRRSGGNRR